MYPPAGFKNKEKIFIAGALVLGAVALFAGWGITSSTSISGVGDAEVSDSEIDTVCGGAVCTFSDPEDSSNFIRCGWHPRMIPILGFINAALLLVISVAYLPFASKFIPAGKSSLVALVTFGLALFTLVTAVAAALEILINNCNSSLYGVALGLDQSQLRYIIWAALLFIVGAFLGVVGVFSIQKAKISDNEAGLTTAPSPSA